MHGLLRLSALPEEIGREEDLWVLLGRLEHEQLELKSSANHLTEPISSFAMTDGGLIVLGIDDKRRLIGCEMSQQVLDRVRRAAHGCGVDIQMKAIKVAGIPLTVVAVPEVRGRIVTTPDGRLLRRVGSDSVPLVGDAMARFVREREDRAAEDEALPVFDAADFDVDLVNTALAQDARPPVDGPELLRGLIDLGVAVPQSPPADAQVTLAAALLFAKAPERFVPGATLQVIRRVGVGPAPGPTEAREELSGPLTQVLDDALAFISEHTKRYQVVQGTRRTVLPEYPVEVLREALLNALSHRDYGLKGGTIDVTVWDDRVEVRSPGSLPGPITVDNMRSEHYSRNRRLMRVLKLLGLVEEYGEGVDRMIQQMEARLMEPPMFAATPTSVTVTLRNRFLIDVEDQAWLALLGHLNLSPSERRALVVARREGGVTPRRLRRLMPAVDVDAVLRTAVVKGLLVRAGQAGGATYQLSDELVMRAGSSGLEAQSRKRQMLLDEMQRRGSVSTTEGADLLAEDMATVRHLLNDLVLAGLAKAEGRTRARRYLPTV
jgi:ATP-dependent DNA helicase RecG